MVRCGQVCPHETAFFDKILKPGDVIVDIGANIGYYTLRFARNIGAQGKVISFEPSPQNYEILTENVSINKYSNVELHQKALTSKPGMIKLYCSDENSGDHHSYATPEARKIIEVESATLDSIIGERKIDYIKMDIQDAEYEVFKGMRQTIDNNPNLIISTEFWQKGLIDSGIAPQDFFDCIKNFGFNIYQFDEQNKNPILADTEALIKSCTHENEGHTTSMHKK